MPNRRRFTAGFKAWMALEALWEGNRSDGGCKGHWRRMDRQRGWMGLSWMCLTVRGERWWTSSLPWPWVWPTWIQLAAR